MKVLRCDKDPEVKQKLLFALVAAGMEVKLVPA
jgi:hypothetical protein